MLELESGQAKLRKASKGHDTVGQTKHTECWWITQAKDNGVVNDIEIRLDEWKDKPNHTYIFSGQAHWLHTTCHQVWTIVACMPYQQLIYEQSYQ